MFESLARLLHVPEGNVQAFRETLIDVILKNPTRYGFNTNMKDIKRIRAWKDEQSFPPFAVIQACADEWKCNVIIHRVGGQELTIRSRNPDVEESLHLSCLGGVHFNYYSPQLYNVASKKTMMTQPVDNHTWQGYQEPQEKPENTRGDRTTANTENDGQQRKKIIGHKDTGSRK